MTRSSVSSSGRARRVLPSWENAVSEDLLGKWAMNQMLINVSTRRFKRSVRLPGGDVPASDGAGLSKSATSRRFVALSAARMKAWMETRLDDLDLLAIQIDGIHMDEDMLLVAAIGVDANGDKHPLGLVEGATENATTVQALIDNLVERGYPAALAGLLRALYRAARFCDAPANAPYVASLLARRAWLAVDSHAILSSLPGTLGRNESRFHAHAATYPWRSHALWFLSQMARWRLIEQGLPLQAIAERVYRPDLYAAALAPAGAPIPEADRKREGEHAAEWSLSASPAPIPMGPDRFCDGAVFDPEAIV